MYSVVLLAGMAAGSDNTPPPVAVQGVPLVGCTGCTGCTGYVAGCTGCSGYTAGCTGSCHGGLFHRLHHHKHASHGCGGSCFGSCYGSCFSSPAMPPYGSCFSNGYTYGGYGSYYHSSPAVYGTYLNVAAPPVVVVPVENKFVTPGTKKPDDVKKPDVDPKKPDVDPKKTGNNGAANLRFKLPADAKLYVDGRLTNGDGSERTFFTPPLESGVKFYYEVKAELMVNGEMVTEEKRVIVSAGAEIIESFPKLTAASEKASTVAGK